MKVFIGDGKDEAEVFLNFNPVSRKAQFSEKDIDYGDTILAKLATVLSFLIREAEKSARPRK